MKNKWSKILPPDIQGDSVKIFHMAELNRRKEEEVKAPPHDCSHLQQQAFERGREAGRTEGRSACQEQVQEEIKRALKMASHIAQVRLGGLEERERDIVEVALAIARKILLHELAVDKEVVVRQVRRVLELLPGRELVTLRVHPQDAQLLQSVQATLESEFDLIGQLRIEGRDEVDAGGCVVEQAGLLFDAQISQQLHTISEEFGLQAIGMAPHGLRLPTSSS